MVVEQRVLGRLEHCIRKGQSVLETDRPTEGAFGFPTLDDGLFSEWRSQSLVALQDTVGASHTYALEFDKQTEKGGYVSLTRGGIGILRSLKEDIENGYLIDVRILVAAEIFSDLLDMAGHLLQQGYTHPAASLVGAVLEDGMRRIAVMRSINVMKNDDLSSLNQKCAQARVYNVLTRKKIDQWTHLRNQADHGNFDEYTNQDVREMHQGVATFLESYLHE